MAWGDWDSQDIAESSPGGGAATSGIELAQGEKIHFFAWRKDAAAAGDDWSIEVQGTIASGVVGFADSPPLRGWRQRGSQRKKDFVVHGPYMVRVYVENAETTDLVSGTVYWRKDGGGTPVSG